MKKSRKLVYNVGINDADYNVYEYINGKIVRWCPYYDTWKGMLRRCYSEKYQSKKPTYKGCSVCDEWLTFSNFKNWMETQDYKGKHLDKDLLKVGNRVYSPSLCVFVHHKINTFTTDRGNARGDYMLGVNWHEGVNQFLSRCCNPLTGKREYLGLFLTEIEAHLAWKKQKHEFACQLAESEYCNDPRLAEALRTRYL